MIKIATGNAGVNESNNRSEIGARTNGETKNITGAIKAKRRVFLYSAQLDP